MNNIFPENSNTKPTVWTIAGSDCTAGAGIQADIKTMHNLGADPSCVITAVTAQNHDNVLAINAVLEEVIQSQISALIKVDTPKVIKIGLLANARQVKLIAEQINQIKSNAITKPYVIYDPVAIASNGGPLTEEDLLPAVKTLLLPLVDLITPNKHELIALTGICPQTWTCLQAASKKLLNLGVGASIIKGGHIDITENKSIDVYSSFSDSYWLSSNTILTDNSHGTGCTFSSAITVLLAQGYLVRDAFVIAKAYINQGLNVAKKQTYKYAGVWQGGWPNNISNYPEVLSIESLLNNNPSKEPHSHSNRKATNVSFPSCGTNKLGLYPVVDSLQWLQQLLQLGIKTIQYREKKLKGDKLSNAISQAVKLGEQYQARLFINDFWEYAIEHNAYGVHLGQEDLQTADLKAIKQAGLRLGISTHGHYELLKALQYKPSYIAIGAIFPTKTKDMTGQIQGLSTLKKLVQLTSNTPIVAIGGISLLNAKDVLMTKVGSIAVVTAITRAENTDEAVKNFQQIIEQQLNE
ncbi:thiamine phosphate synthase [Psychrosphaera haliotis]|uniref:thiamine phosphate synthase n=1 Tax=Psychrosphaera haliotis TaxID=555083 RepID=UPI0031D40E86